MGLIDVVLDDGGHTYEQQIITTECLLSNMNDGGIILVEDTHTSYMEGFGPKSKSFIKYTKMLIDKVNMRFGNFSNHPSLKDEFWSIEKLRVWLHLKLIRASNLKSEPTDNGGIDDIAEDFRYADNPKIRKVNKIIRIFSFMKHFPMSRTLVFKLKILIANSKFNANKYFR